MTKKNRSMRENDELPNVYLMGQEVERQLSKVTNKYRHEDWLGKKRIFSNYKK